MLRAPSSSGRPRVPWQEGRRSPGARTLPLAPAGKVCKSRAILCPDSKQPHARGDGVSPKGYAHILTPKTQGCDCVWKKGPWRCT